MIKWLTLSYVSQVTFISIVLQVVLKQLYSGKEENNRNFIKYETNENLAVKQLWKDNRFIIQLRSVQCWFSSV